MFGYIKPLEPELRVRELDTYKAVYCGLCRGLAQSYGPLARFTLSYDFTFTAMLQASLSDTPPTFSPQRCPYNPFKKRPHLTLCEPISASCDMAMLLLDCKVLDNLEDDGPLSAFKWLLARPLSRRAALSAAARHPQAAAITAQLTGAQKTAEINFSGSLDAACDPTATALSGLLALMSEEPSDCRALSRLGYMLGRYVYLCDAIDDYEDDRAEGQFNPIGEHFDRDRLTQTIRATIAEACAAYALLSPLYFKEILDNILYLGLQSNAERLLEGGSSHERSI